MFTGRIAWFALATLLLAGCEDPFQYSPWEVKVPAHRRSLNARVFEAVQQRVPADTMGLRFAVVGDPQSYYADTRDVLAHAEAFGDLHFSVVVGDLTDQGLAAEFDWYADVLEAVTLPTLSLIGNHDHLGNGRPIYELMFGPRNAVYHLGGVRLVLFDNVEFESELPVDHAWLNGVLAAPFDGPTVVFMHIHPGDPQLAGTPLQALRTIMEAHRPDAVFMGHKHAYSTGVFPGGTPWTTVAWPREREYLRVEVRPDTVLHERITVP